MQTKLFQLSNVNQDGHVNLTTSTFLNNASSLLLGADIWDETGDNEIFVKFLTVNIPKNAVVTNAVLTLSIYETLNGDISTTIYGTLDDPTDYTSFINLTKSEHLALLAITAATSETRQINVTDIINELVNSDVWIEGSQITLYTNGTTKTEADAGADIDSYEYNISGTGLVVQYENPIEITTNTILGGSRLESFEYELLSLSNGQYIHNGFITNDILSCNVNIDFTRDIISDVTIEAKNNTDINFLSDLIRPWYIVTSEGVNYKFPLGTYLLSSPKIQSDGNLITRSINGYDLILALEQDKTTTSISYAIGTNVIDTIKSVLASVGTFVKYDISNVASNEVLNEVMTYEMGKSKLFIVNSLLNAINYYPIWCDGMGTFKAIPWNDKLNTVWDFIDNDSSLYESGITQGIDYSTMFNRVIIKSSQLEANNEPIVADLTFEDINLTDYPLSYTNIGRYITKILDSEAVTQAYADLRATRELFKMLELEESIDYNHMFVSNNFIDGLPSQGDAFRFKNTLLNVDNVYKIVSQRWTLKVGNCISSTIRRFSNV